MWGKKVLFCLLLLSFFLLSVYSAESESAKALFFPGQLVSSLPSFLEPESLAEPVEPTMQTDTSKPLVQRLAAQLEAWIAYSKEVTLYILAVRAWRQEVLDSWKVLKNLYERQETAYKMAILARDTEIKALNAELEKEKAEKVLYGIAGSVIGSGAGYAYGRFGK